MLVAAVVGVGEPASIWTGVAVVVGMQALGALVFLVVLVSRQRSATAAWGIAGVLGAHRLLGIAAIALVLIHVLAVLADDPGNVALLHPTEAPARAAAGIGALVALVGAAGFAAFVRRAQRRPHYEVWREGHLAFAALAVVLSALHVLWLGRLIYDPLWLAWLLVLAVVVVGALIRRWWWRPRQSGFLVRDVRVLDPTVSVVSVVPVGRKPTPFEPGQFVWLRLESSVSTEEHPLSISARAGEPWQFVVRHRGDWSAGPMRELRPGSFVWLDGPYGALTLHGTTGPELVMVAVGVGLAPVMSMLRTLAHQGDQRPVRLLLGPRETLFREDIAELATCMNLAVYPALSRPLTPDALAAVLPDPDVRERLDYFVCGPESLVVDVLAMLETLGIPDRQIRTERFDS